MDKSCVGQEIDGTRDAYNSCRENCTAHSECHVVSWTSNASSSICRQTRRRLYSTKPQFDSNTRLSRHSGYTYMQLMHLVIKGDRQKLPMTDHFLSLYQRFWSQCALRRRRDSLRGVPESVGHREQRHLERESCIMHRSYAFSLTTSVGQVSPQLTASLRNCCSPCAVREHLHNAHLFCLEQEQATECIIVCIATRDHF